jgi:SAM-dependent methyltransferase
MPSSEPDPRSTAFTSASVPENYERRLVPVIFEPWARLLVDEVGVRPGDRVLDVASGTGVVARLAAQRVGPDGHVIATDVSGDMLARAMARPLPADSAQIEFVEAPATDLPLPDGAVDVVLCQQGLPFFSDRPGALAEMHRVLRAGGAVGVSIWATGRRLEPFDDYGEALEDAGVEPAFPNVYDTSSFCMSAAEVEALLTAAGFSSVDVSAVDQTIVWPDTEAAVAGIFGTPFGPVVDALPTDVRRVVDEDLARRFATPPGEPIHRTTTAVVARATA